MYIGVPSDVPTDVIVPLFQPPLFVDRPPRVTRSRDAEIALATPKSVTIAAPPDRRMLSGLMSR